MAGLSPVLKQATSVLVERGEGAYLFDTGGNRYLDFTSGVGVTSTGHCHPRVVSAAREQINKLIHGQYTTVLHRPLIELSDKLGAVLPRHLDSVFYLNSGSEAVEAAVRLARHVTGKQNIIAFQGGFHGRTTGAVALTSAGARYRYGSAPLVPSVALAPFPYAYRMGWTQSEAVRFALQELDYLLDTVSPPSETAALLIEPVLGEGGYVPAPPEFLEGIQQRATDCQILLVVDEIQTGAGRTGMFWAHEYSNIKPDILLSAKGIASGFPLSLIAAPHGHMLKAKPGSQGGTYGGNAVACAAAIATLEVIEEEELLKNATLMGDRLRAGLDQLMANNEAIGDVRGIGLMQAIEFTDAAGSPDTERAGRFRLEAERRGLLLLTCGTRLNTIRMIPPLIVNPEQVDEAISTCETALKATTSSPS